MRHRRRLALALVSMAVGVAASVAFSAPAIAEPGGNNGTVKIDGEPVDDGISNEPHVPCEFAVQFFGFDKGQEADINFNIWSPSGDGELLLSEHKVISNDPAAGGELNETFLYSADDFDLTNAELQPNQGYHLKLTIISDGVPGGKKHKVFWLQPCEATESPSPTPSTASPSETTPPPPTTPGTPGESVSPTTPPSGLPVTGAAATTLALTGLGLIGGGVALVWLRRRRDISFMS